MEITKEQMLERVKANNDIVNALMFLNEAQSKKWELEKNDRDCEWRNTKMSYWKDICSKYPEEKLLNCYGDIFFIDLDDEDCAIGRRVLWNFGLSTERYEIQKIVETDCDGNYDYTDYEISVIKE
jgi:hypothetical protein